MKVWLSPEVLEWRVDKLYDEINDDYTFLKPYGFLRYAKKRFSEVDEHGTGDKENLVLNDIVVNLKQALEHRENALHEKFAFSQLPYAKKKYKQLTQFRLVQPIFANKLRILRNIVIHEQKAPLGKDKERIEELWEFAWYYLRSTDSFLTRYIEGMFFYSPELDETPFYDMEYYGLSSEENCIEIKKILFSKDERIQLSGKQLPSSLFSLDEKENWLEMDVHSISMWNCITPAVKKYRERERKRFFEEMGEAYTDILWKKNIEEEEILKKLEKTDDDIKLAAMKDEKETQYQRTKECLDSGSPIEFSATAVSGNAFLERMVSRYLGLYILR